jgi:predicted patatin/cPLA2 family phospholipase
LVSGRAGNTVLRLLSDRVRSGSGPGQRADGARIALAIEGGGMRGTVTAGMALALAERSLLPAFDAVYGSSAGAITGAWLVSSRPEGMRGWANPVYARALIRWSALLRGRPVTDVRTLIEVLYTTEHPMDFESVLASEVPLHPLATDATTGAASDLRPLMTDPARLRLALRASASLPFLAGPPVTLDGRRFYDAGVAESIPLRTPLAQDATHIVVLRSRPPRVAESAGTPADPALAQAAFIPAVRPRPAREARLLARTVLRKESPELRAALLTRAVRTFADVIRIAEMEAAGTALSVHPAPGGPPVSRLTTDGAILAAAFEAGREAVDRLPGLAVTDREGGSGSSRERCACAPAHAPARRGTPRSR